MKRTFKESPLIPFSKEDINGFFKTMGYDVQEMIDDFVIRVQNCSNIGEILYHNENLKQKISEYFISVKIK